MNGEQLEMLYRGILENALDCIITMDGAGRIVEFNPAAERTFAFGRQSRRPHSSSDEVVTDANS